MFFNTWVSVQTYAYLECVEAAEMWIQDTLNHPPAKFCAIWSVERKRAKTRVDLPNGTLDTQCRLRMQGDTLKMTTDKLWFLKRYFASHKSQKWDRVSLHPRRAKVQIERSTRLYADQCPRGCEFRLKAEREQLDNEPHSGLTSIANKVTQQTLLCGLCTKTYRSKNINLNRAYGMSLNLSGVDRIGA